MATWSKHDQGSFDLPHLPLLSRRASTRAPITFATVAGMPPEYGLYAAMVPAIIAALWGSSWHLVSGPTTAIAIVVFATISPLAPPGTEHYVKLVLTLTLLVGVFQLLLGLLRMGTGRQFRVAYGRRRLHGGCGHPDRCEPGAAFLRRRHPPRQRRLQGVRGTRAAVGRRQPLVLERRQHTKGKS